MSAEPPPINPHLAYLQSTIAPRFAQMVKQAVDRLDALQREIADLRSARGSIAWEVEGEGGGTWFLNLSAGEMTVGAEPIEPPFMRVAQSADNWQRFVSGAAPVGFLSGGWSNRGMGKTRIDRVRTIRGSVGFVVTALPDGSDWSFVTRFGPGPFPAEPQTVVTVTAGVLQQLQREEINPQLAFMQGQIKMTGDAALAMQLGMALFL